MKIKNFCIFWLPAIIYAACIFSISSVSQPPAPPLFRNSDKILHFLVYTGFGFLVLRALSSSKERFKGLNLRTLAVLIVFTYGISDELHQYFVPGRHMEFLDMLCDGLGGYAGQLFFRLRK